MPPYGGMAGLAPASGPAESSGAAESSAWDVSGCCCVRHHNLSPLSLWRCRIVMSATSSRPRVPGHRALGESVEELCERDRLSGAVADSIYQVTSSEAPPTVIRRCPRAIWFQMRHLCTCFPNQGSVPAGRCWGRRYPSPCAWFFSAWLSAAPTKVFRCCPFEAVSMQHCFRCALRASAFPASRALFRLEAAGPGMCHAHAPGLTMHGCQHGYMSVRRRTLQEVEIGPWTACKSSCGAARISECLPACPGGSTAEVVHRSIDDGPLKGCAGVRAAGCGGAPPAGRGAGGQPARRQLRAAAPPGGGPAGDGGRRPRPRHRGRLAAAAGGGLGSPYRLHTRPGALPACTP